MRRRALLIVVVGAVACGASGDREVTPAAAAHRYYADWQGSWVLPYSVNASHAYRVMVVDGRTVTQWDDDQRQQGSLELVAPCLARIRTGSTHSYLPFVAEARGMALEQPLGVRVDGTWYACLGERVVVAGVPGRCRVYGDGLVAPDRDSGEEARCASDGARMTIAWSSRDVELVIDGDRLRAADRQPSWAVRAASLDDARARAASRESVAPQPSVPPARAVVARFESSSAGLAIVIDGGARWLLPARPDVDDLGPFAQAVARAGGTIEGLLLWGSELATREALAALTTALRQADITMLVNCRADLHNCT